MAKCDDCAAKAARTAAGPMMPDAPIDKPGGDDLEAWKASVEERLAALEDANMGAALASLDSMPVDIRQFVNS